MNGFADFRNFCRNELVIFALKEFKATDWHWFKFHFSQSPLHPLGDFP
jgi:hypothetical protein